MNYYQSKKLLEFQYKLLEIVCGLRGEGKMKRVLNKMENSELLAHFLMSRDNLVSIRRALIDKPQDQELNSLFEMEEKRYDELLIEVYRRMNNGRKKR